MNWSKVRVEVSHAGRHALEKEIRGLRDDNDPHRVMKYGHILLEECFGDRKPMDRLKLMRVGLLAMEWAHLHELEFTSIELRLLARGHYEYWLCSGANAEEYNLTRAKDLYGKTIQHIDNISHPDVLIEYCRVLQHSGEEEKASQIALEVIKTFEHSIEYANYVFYVGCLQKSLGMHDKAATYLFEAMKQGPPRYFSKLEMMFLISRNIEENAKRRGENCDDAYRIVFDHEKLEAHIQEDAVYENWINNSDTWRRLGDKCTIVGVYSLARDLYGQGLLRDELAFLKPKQWFGFAKSCYRSGRMSDAVLSLEQALTMDPTNQQFRYYLSRWSSCRNSFEELLDGGITAIIELLSLQTMDSRIKEATIIQSNYRCHKQKRLGLDKKLSCPDDMKQSN